MQVYSHPPGWRLLSGCTIVGNMTDSSYADPEQTYELDGRLMAPRQGASSTFEELIAARTTFLEIIRETYWNPWVREDRASEESAAVAVMEQWEVVDPNPPTSRLETQEEFESRREAESAADSARQERDRERYDPARERARLSLLEHESLLRHRQGNSPSPGRQLCCME